MLVIKNNYDLGCPPTVRGRSTCVQGRLQTLGAARSAQTETQTERVGVPQRSRSAAEGLPWNEGSWLPWEFGSGKVSLATKCITVVFPNGSLRAGGTDRRTDRGKVSFFYDEPDRTEGETGHAETDSVWLAHPFCRQHSPPLSLQFLPPSLPPSKRACPEH